MRITFFNTLLQRFSPRWPFLLYSATWTTLLTVMVAVASFSPELAFVSAINPSYSFSAACHATGSVRVPLDIPNEVFCFPAKLFKGSKMDMLVPLVFAAVIVPACAYAVKALGLWEADDDEQH